MNTMPRRLALVLCAFVLVSCGGGTADGSDPQASQTPSASSDGIKRRFAAGAARPAAAADDTTESIYSEGGKLMRADRNVGALGNDLFGEQVNLYDGSTSFVQTDLELPGNGALPVRVGRRLTTGNTYLVRGHFGDWDLDIPHLHGVFSHDKGWIASTAKTQTATQRCSQYSAPPDVNGLGGSGGGTFSPAEYWHGSFLYVPGEGSQEILVANQTAAAVNPTGSLATAKLTTKNRWTLLCGTPLKNDSGEGFTAVAPDGTRYVFDWMVRRPYTQIGKPLGTPPQSTPADTDKTAPPATPVPTDSPPSYIL